MEPKVLYEDDSLFIIDKPSGITVNRSDTTQNEQTLQDWVEDYLKVSKEGKVPNVSKAFGTFDTSDTFDTFCERSGIVHRLDKETSGILIVAKTPWAFEFLQKQFKERKVKKTYLALVHGEVAQREGEISVPVGRLPWNRKRFGIVAGGREAVTRYRVISNFKFQISNEELTFLEIYPETGRTHQIRVHLKHIGHPVFSDPLYAGRKTSREDRKLLKRLFLHAAKISFYHPASNKLIHFESKLPEDLRKLIARLKQD